LGVRKSIQPAKTEWWGAGFAPDNFGKIIRIVATQCHILQLKCTKFDFSWEGSAPDPTRRAYSAPQTPELYLVGVHLYEWEGGQERRGRERREFVHCPMKKKRKVSAYDTANIAN